MTLRLTWRRIGIALAALVLGGLLFGWSGLFYVGATGGHWGVTNWFLHWVMQNSVRTYSLLVEEPPDLRDRALLARGAGHYATGCAPCHAAPGEPQNPVVSQSLPAPPDFSRRIDEWDSKEFFRIVQHGVRYSGMPAWPEPGRQDEVWSMVALLEALPSLSPEEYRRLAYGQEAAEFPAGGSAALARLSDPAAPVLADCARCHNRDGLGRDGDAFPIIAGQSETYLVETLRAFAEGRRHSGMMQPPAARAGDEALQAIARHYAAQPRAAAAAAPADAALIEQGERIAREGVVAQQVPACLSCHGDEALRRNLAFPRLDGQHAGYLQRQLEAWQSGVRGGGPRQELMRTVADRLTADQVKAVSAWFAAQGTRQEAASRP
ncbi:c-type cytochrome [Teichococcus vastitatis]|uniref:C-type cytochrome n=1 Tax=Teichococcus vastitatis TaxID=2307076 RepID=A0ABS9VZ89_9PROT|nr:c-type cytochrome [Pseudoroseomonas vastitatis]MCI0752313.1 c-type cytochrome [Pseudoroseomonas vastitatis]